MRPYLMIAWIWRALWVPARGLAVLLLVFGHIAAGQPAFAQPCTSDSQCRDFGQTRAYCSGNSLVVKQSRCIGRCQSVEISRTPCPGPCVADRCIGGSLESSPASPPRGGGFVAGVCTTLCTCKGRTLTYGVGYAAKAEQCGRRTVDCVYGCTCDPEPRCLKRGES